MLTQRVRKKALLLDVASIAILSIGIASDVALAEDEPQSSSEIATCMLTLMITAVAAFCLQPGTARAGDAQVARGKYLVGLAGCTDCHTPGYFLGKPDPARFLGGSDVGFRVPGAGTVVGPNLTPDKETGLGNWTTSQIVTAIRGGVTPDNRVLSPVMPWSHYANLTPADVGAIVAYLKTLPAVRNKVPGPFGADQKPTTVTWTITPPESAPAKDSSSK